MEIKKKNPIIWSDFPDPDMVRVEDTYYMISTTMHMMPGAVILRSYDLANWEIASYLYDTLEDNPAHRLEDGKNIYGAGMWAASLKYHNGMFYVCFVANDTHKTYLFTSKSIDGPWEKREIDGFYHDSSLLFDDDGKAYIVYGNRDIYITELKEDLSGPKPGGLNKKIITDTDNVSLGYEGAHFYKINGKYYIFFIHWLAYGSHRRVEACYVSDSPGGEYRGKNVLDDDMGYHNAGVAQGGIVDTPDGDWYAIFFQDHGAVGRIPVLVPVSWKDDFPVFGENGKVPIEISVKSTRPDYKYAPLFESDDFYYQPDANGKISLKKVWQWNHNPKNDFWTVLEKPGCLRIYSDKICPDVLNASNVLTQRTFGPRCTASVQVDGTNMKDGDFAGLVAFQGCYGMISLARENGEYFLVMRARKDANSDNKGVEYAKIKISSPEISLKAEFNFIDNIDEVDFYYKDNGEWKKLGKTHKLRYMLDHFMGCRIGLFFYSTSQIGGNADFSRFEYGLDVRD